MGIAPLIPTPMPLSTEVYSVGTLIMLKFPQHLVLCLSLSSSLFYEPKCILYLGLSLSGLVSISSFNPFTPPPFFFPPSLPPSFLPPFSLLSLSAYQCW